MERIEDCISFLLGKAYQRVTLDARRRLAPYGVTPVQYAVLKVLWEKDGLNGAELCERLRLDSATITGVLDRLEHSEIVERRADARDRRISRIFLTPRGHDLQGPLDSTMDEMNADFYARFTASEADQLWKELARLGNVEGSS